MSVALEQKVNEERLSFWVGTWNIHSWTDCDDQPNLYRIINALKDTKVDILGLQEVRDKPLKKYKHDRSFQFNIKHNIDKNINYPQNALDTLKIKTEFLKYSTSTSNDINYNDDKKKKKKQKNYFGVATASKYEIIETIYYNSFIQFNIIKLPSNHCIGLIVVHLNFRDENKRIEQYNQILQFTKEYQSKYPLILLGDFNALKKSDYTKKEWKHIEEIRQENNWELPQNKLMQMITRSEYFKDCLYQYIGNNNNIKIHIQTTSNKSIESKQDNDNDDNDINDFINKPNKNKKSKKKKKKKQHRKGHNDKNTIYYGTKFGDVFKDNSFGTSRFNTRIDYVFANDLMLQQFDVISYLHLSHNGCSDHSMVRVQFRLKC